MSNESETSTTNTPETGSQSSLNGTSPRVGASGKQSSVVGRPLDSPSTATMAGLVAAVAAALAVLRYAWSWARPKPKSADERLVEATQALGSAAVGFGGRAARRTTSAALRTTSAAERTASVAQPVVKEAAGRAADVAHDAAGLAAEGARKVAAAAAEGASEVGEGVEAVQKAWNKFMRRLTIVVFGSLGYVLGAAAGRERYEQIVSVARKAQGAAQGARQ